ADDVGEIEAIPRLRIPADRPLLGQPRGEPALAEGVDEHAHDDAHEEDEEHGDAGPHEPRAGRGGERALAGRARTVTTVPDVDHFGRGCDRHQPLPPVEPRYRNERPRNTTAT